MNLQQILKEIGINVEIPSSQCMCGTIGEEIDRKIAERKKDPSFTQMEYKEILNQRKAIEYVIKVLQEVTGLKDECYEIAMQVACEHGFPILARAIGEVRNANNNITILSKEADKEMEEARNRSHERQRKELGELFDEETHGNN